MERTERGEPTQGQQYSADTARSLELVRQLCDPLTINLHASILGILQEIKRVGAKHGKLMLSLDIGVECVERTRQSGEGKKERYSAEVPYISYKIKRKVNSMDNCTDFTAMLDSVELARGESGVYALQTRQVPKQLCIFDAEAREAGS